MYPCSATQLSAEVLASLGSLHDTGTPSKMLDGTERVWVTFKLKSPFLIFPVGSL